jgi:thiol-disulfide isomerase/thioredoxin
MFITCQAPNMPRGTAELLANADVIAVYFSAHWCPPCRQFTPALARVYSDMKAAGKKFEIVFVSSDQDESGFDTYFASMPWLAVPYESREVKQRLGARFGVRAIPTLVLLYRNGGLITKDGRAAIAKDPSGTSWWPGDAADADVDEVHAARENIGFQAAIECFHEPIDFTLDGCIAQGRDVATVCCMLPKRLQLHVHCDTLAMQHTHCVVLFSLYLSALDLRVALQLPTLHYQFRARAR